MAEIPLDVILVEILPNLPAKSLIRFKCVCKVFKKTISSKKFIKNYFSKHISTNPNHLLILLAESSNCLYIYDLDSPETFLRRLDLIVDPCWATNINDDQWNSRFHIVGSCNGLICIVQVLDWLRLGFDYYFHRYIFLNPSTGVYRKVPHRFEFDIMRSYYGFGFDAATDDYKLVHVSEIPKPSDFYSIQKRVAKVYSFRDDSCRLVNYNSVIEFAFTRNETALFLCGSLHWVFFTFPELKSTIRCFDITTETWGDDLYLPYPYYNNYNCYYCHLVFKEIGQLDGCLSSTFENAYDTYDIWIMKEYGVTESWIKLYSVVLPSVPSVHVYPVGYHRASTHILLCESNRSCTKIVSYDTSCASVVDVEAIFSTFLWHPYRFGTLNYACICTGSLANIPRRAVMIGTIFKFSFKSFLIHKTSVIPQICTRISLTLLWLVGL